MIELKTTIEAAGEKSGKIAGLTASLTGMDYGKCFECLYPFILEVLRKNMTGLPKTMDKLNEYRDKAGSAVTSFLSAFPDSVKEELIKTAFDDILTGEKLSEINNTLAEKNISAKIASVSLEIAPEKE